MKILFSILLLFSSFTLFAQRQHRDTVIAGMEVRISWNTVTPTEAIFYMPGAGQVGGGTLADSNLTKQFGPEFWLLNGWNGQVLLGNGIHNPTLVTIIQSSAISAGFTRPSNIKAVLDGLIASRFHAFMKDSAWHASGFSAGGWVYNIFNVDILSAGNTSCYKYFKSMVDIEGVEPTDLIDATAPFPTSFVNRVNSSRFHFLGFEQINDTRNVWKIRDAINEAQPGTAWMIWSDFGGGGHSNFNDFMNPASNNWTATNANLVVSASGQNSNFIATGQNIFQWMLRQGDTTLTAVNTPPTASAGSPQQIQLPANSVTLTGIASGTNGATIVSTVWSFYKMSNGTIINPSGGTITSPNSLTTTITGLTTWGNNVVQFVATDNHGLKDTSYVPINVIPACNTNPSANQTATTTATAEIFRPNAGALGLKGKDTLFIPAGNYDLIELGNFSGDPCHPITIINAGGLVTIGTLRIAAHSQYIHWTGTGVPGLTYGFKIYSGTNTGVGADMFNHIEMDHLWIDSIPNGTGFIMKTQPDTSNVETLYNNYVMDVLHVHDCKITRAGGEAMYIGHTSPFANDPGQLPLIPLRLDSVEIDHMIIDNCLWDGIQVSAARDFCRIHDNIITHYGTGNISSQQCGIILGGCTRGDVWNNIVINGTGNGGELFGYGICNWFNNTWDSCGRDGTGNGQQTMFCNDLVNPIETSDPKQQLVFFNNTIKNPQILGAVTINADNGQTIAANIHDNTFCIPGANQGTWQGLYLHLNPPATLTNNILITSCGLAPLVPDYFLFRRKKVFQ